MLRRIIFKIIKFYQRFISPVIGYHCRFYPSCSEYSYQIIEKRGLTKGLLLSLKRILKCHPWHPGGVDNP